MTFEESESDDDEELFSRDDAPFTCQCGKVMEEERSFFGMFVCPDHRIVLNEKPPFVRKCEGYIMTVEACDALEAEMNRQYLERN